MRFPKFIHMRYILISFYFWKTNALLKKKIWTYRFKSNIYCLTRKHLSDFQLVQLACSVRWFSTSLFIFQRKWKLSRLKSFKKRSSRHKTSTRRCMDVLFNVLKLFQHPYDVVLTSCVGWGRLYVLLEYSSEITVECFNWWEIFKETRHSDCRQVKEMIGEPWDTLLILAGQQKEKKNY